MGGPIPTPPIRRILAAHEESDENTVGGRLFSWSQRAALSTGEVLGSKAARSMEAVINGTFDQTLEASRQRALDARMLCLTPVLYCSVLMERLITPHELGEEGQRLRTEKKGQHASWEACRLASYGPEPLCAAR